MGFGVGSFTPSDIEAATIGHADAESYSTAFPRIVSDAFLSQVGKGTFTASGGQQWLQETAWRTVGDMIPLTAIYINLIAADGGVRFLTLLFLLTDLKSHSPLSIDSSLTFPINVKPHFTASSSIGGFLPSKRNHQHLRRGMLE